MSNALALTSLTGRTAVTATVDEAGDVSLTVTREGRTLHSFSIGREQDIPKTASIRKEKGAVIVTVDNKDVDSIPVV